MTQTTEVAVPVRKRLDLSVQSLIGLAAGVALGLFIGERAARLQIAADAYVQLLQMTVLPYITLSLIGGLGSLSAADARRLGAGIGKLLLALWAIALLAVFAFPLMFPFFQTASFFSATLLQEGEAVDLLGLYIPANPFNSLANNVVPAVVLFSAFVGIALIGMPRRAVVLDIVQVANEAVGRVARFVVSLTPYGLFAIAAVIAGTFDPAEVAKIQVYLISYIAISLLLALWVLPGLIAVLTPVPHRAILARTRHALIVAFTTGSLFVVLPLLADDTRALLRAHLAVNPHDEQLPDVIIPASFNFPHTAKLLSLSFIPFAAWFSGASLPVDQYPALGAMGVASLFGSVMAAIPYLLDTFRIPADTFQLFLATSVVNSRFGTMLSAVHTLTIALLGTCVVIGAVRFEARKILRFALMTAVIGGGTIAGTRLLLGTLVNRPYQQDKTLAGMRALRDRGTPRLLPAGTPRLEPPAGSVLDRIQSRRTLRVGYVADSLPYAFTNGSGELVGFDVEMAQQLARDLEVQLELVPIERRVLDQGVDPAICDLVMSGTAGTADRSTRVLFSSSYLDETLALVVQDYRRAAFASWTEVRAMTQLRIGIPASAYYESMLRRELPNATVLTFDAVDAMFRPQTPPLDALVLTAERGSAYTIRHPEFSVVVPKPRPLKVPLVYLIAGRDHSLAATVDAWIDLKRKDGTIDDLFAHWILGKNASPHRRRWSILDDVLRRRE
jgi:Na+/H+-dicarboxylate symporter/ABC-type amino acid transport substrate-binding protein